jgi:dihydroorotase
MHYDLILKNGILVNPDDNKKCDIAVKDGIIVKTGISDTDTAYEIYDAEGKYVLPGIIDAHVHFRDPGLTEKEDFESGSIAAAMGGITMVADMPNVIPVTSTAGLFKEKIKIAKEKSYIDFAFFALLNNDNLNEMEGLKKTGALGFKVFLGTSTGDIACPSQPVLAQQMQKAASLDMRIGFHCETSELNLFYTSMYKNSQCGEKEYGRILSESRPVFSEALAMQTVICYAQYTQTKIHILHITSGDTALLAMEAKQKGIDLSAETCPHYLFLNAENYSHKVYPPIRSENHRKGLWDAIGKGFIDMIASDHAPHTVNEKMQNIWDAPAGLCGVETSVPLMLNEVNKGTLTINDYVRLASQAPAKIWGLYPKKGNLLPGADADFTIVDMNIKKTIFAKDLHSKNLTSPYDGMKLQGFPAATIVRGKFIMKDGKLTGKKGYGELVSP